MTSKPDLSEFEEVFRSGIGYNGYSEGSILTQEDLDGLNTYTLAQKMAGAYHESSGVCLKLARAFQEGIDRDPDPAQIDYPAYEKST
ncbi:MAG: hypothetical protein M3O22_01675 [Pseudomonadota bacterium]|nr:hypothetical protein [Pseudomonadota bacterium]